MRHTGHQLIQCEWARGLCEVRRVKCRYPKPFSPVQRQRKFSQVAGTTSSRSCTMIFPASTARHVNLRPNARSSARVPGQGYLPAIAEPSSLPSPIRISKKTLTPPPVREGREESRSAKCEVHKGMAPGRTRVGTRAVASKQTQCELPRIRLVTFWPGLDWR